MLFDTILVRNQQAITKRGLEVEMCGECNVAALFAHQGGCVPAIDSAHPFHNDYRVPYSAIRSGFAYFGKDISDEDITCLINSLVAARLLKCYTSHNHKTVVFSKKECSVCWDS